MKLLHLALIAGALLLQPLSNTLLTAGDTVRVKTLTFNDITQRSGTWMFPPPQQYEKVLLEYTLKCDQRTTQDQYPCGEWDYLTYIVLTDSTGEWDSTEQSQVNFVVRNTTPDSLPYTENPTAQKRMYRTIQVNRSVFGDWYDVGTADQANAGILRESGGRAQFVITAAELTAAGIPAGPISGIRLTTMDGGAVSVLTVRLVATTATSITSPLRSDNFTTVVKRNVTLVSGANALPFERVFTWDGTSNIVVEIACLSASKNIRLSAGGTSAQGVISDTTRRVLAFYGGDWLELPTEVGSALGNQITVSFWSWGNSQLLPANHNAFEAYDAQGRRVLNVHLPWSDGTVYWDAGRNGGQGPDRIYKAANPQDYEGMWHHWAFVKDATAGTMTVYLDGELFVQGAGKTLGMAGITKFIFGSGASGSYPGMMDEIQIWRKALDQATIRTWKGKHVTPDHPFYTDLVAYYDVEQTTSAGLLRDLGANGNNATMWGMPVRESIGLDKLGHLTLSAGNRPMIGFEAGSSTPTTTREDVVVDAEPKLSNVVLYGNPIQPHVYDLDDPKHPSLPTDTLLVQVAGWMPVIDESGLQVDSVYIPPTTTLKKNTALYFSPVTQFELGRYITPYGIGLDLGENGFKWVYDVTDFAPLLRNNVTLSAGNQQELIDMTFLMIKGKPAREIKQLDQVWYERGAYFPDVLTNKALAPKTIALQPDAKTFRLKAVTSGHDFSNPTNCAEFCRRTHFYAVNGTERFAWDVWKECGDNPVYPQGGTWLVDRTGWCPGAPVDLHEFELTPYTTGKTSVTIDYGVKPDTSAENWGRWEVSGQLVGYTLPTSQVDAELSDVLAPNNWEFYSRFNPICGTPIVVIKNRGAKPLTSCTIRYRVGEGAWASQDWTGKLEFLQSDTVALPTPSWGSANGVNTFIAEVVTNESDEYPDNNAFHTNFAEAPVYYSDLTIQLRTNNYAADQYEWQLRKADGQVIKQASNLADNTTYLDTFNLENGCYEYRLINKLGYGLDFWYYRDQLGTGSLQFKTGTRTIKTFEADFGNTAWIEFAVAPKPTIWVSADTLLFNASSPMPIERTLVVKAANSAPLRIDSVNMLSTKEYFSITNVSKSLPITLGEQDSLEITVLFDRKDIGKATASVRLYSTDELTPIKIVRCIGNTGATGINEPDIHGVAELLVIPNPVHQNARIQCNVYSSDVVFHGGAIVDALGRVVYHLDTTTSNTQWDVPAWLESGRYTVVLETKQGMLTTPITVTK